LWIVPQGDWGKGRIELVQIPSDGEVNDNIVAYWVPENPVKAGEKLHFAYMMKWTTHDPSGHGRATTRATRIGYTAVDRPENQNKHMQVTVEFAGGQLAGMTDPGAVQPHVSAMREVKLSQVR